MKILQAHNYYQLAGGEDIVVENEKKLLLENGHEVIRYLKHNNEINEFSLKNKLKLFDSMTWSQKTFDEVRKVLIKEKPDICHVHNFFPLISPSIYDACKKENIPVVQTLHNFRLICTNGMLLRNGKVCEDCLGKSAFNSTGKKCYRNSHTQTFAVANMIEKNKKNRVWSKNVDAYLCFTEFAKQKFIAHGIKESKLFIKPNFVECTIHEVNPTPKKDYLIYVGRLDSYKGVPLIKEIAASLPLPVKLVGEGELMEEMKGVSNVDLLGKQSHKSTMRLISEATALLFPSSCYEGMPMTILEAFAHQTPVIASNLGAMQSLIKHQHNGLLFTQGSSIELLSCINLLLTNKELSSEITRNAFKDFQEKYSKEENYQTLIKLYDSLLSSKLTN